MFKQYFNIIGNIDALFVALVLNVNVLRIFMGIQDTNLILYFVYFAAIILLFGKNRIQSKFLMKKTSVRYLLGFIIYILFFSFLSLIWGAGDNTFTVLLKFAVALILAFCCIFINRTKIGVVKVYFLFINIVYSLMCLIIPDRVTSMLGENMNYLNATLTLGFSFSIALVDTAIFFFWKKNIKMFISMGLSVLFFLALLRFIARGVLIFPPVILMILLPFLGKNKMGKSVVIVALASLGLLVAIRYYTESADSYALTRMTHLFEDTEDEDRIELWSKCANLMINKSWFYFGGGINAFRSEIFYPHNIFLQILGEFGIIPFVCFISMIYHVIASFLRLNRAVDEEKKEALCFVAVGILYYLMTFSKSFSLYDALPLFMMMAMMFSLSLNSFKNSAINRKQAIVSCLDK